MPADRITHFSGGDSGPWAVTSITPITGATLPACARLAIGGGTVTGTPAWLLSGIASNLRYTRADERAALTARQAGLGRAEATRAALIPISKSDGWWALAQDERLAIYARGQHTAIGMDYLPGIARKLYHGRDLGQPFDFLTWFEFAPGAEADFDHLLTRLRATEEWQHVVREVDIRLTRTG